VNKTTVFTDFGYIFTLTKEKTVKEENIKVTTCLYIPTGKKEIDF